MKRILLPLLLLLANAAFSQQSRIDSLWHATAAAKSDASRSKAYSLLADHMIQIKDYEAADSLARIGLNIALQINNTLLAIDCKILLARSIEGQGRIDDAIPLYREGLRLAVSQGKWLNASETCGFMVKAFSLYLSNPDSSIYYAKQQIEYASKSGSASHEGTAYGNLANLYRQVGRYPEALKASQEALLAFEKSGEIQNQGIVFASTAVIYEMIGEKNFADSCYRKAIAIFEGKGKDDSNNAITRYNYSVLLESQKRYAESEQQLKRVLGLVEGSGDLGLLAAAYTGLGAVAMETNRMDTARVRLLHARDLARQSQEAYTIVEADLAWARLIFKEGQAAEARDIARRALRSYEEFQELEGMMRAAQTIYQSDSALGDFRSAFDHHKLFVRYRDSIRSETNAREIGRLEAQYEADKEKERLVARQEVERAQNRWTLGSVAGGLLLALVIAFTLFRSRRKEKLANAALRLLNEQVSQQKAEIEAQNSEITAQRDQLEATNRKMIELDRMKEELSGMIVHDLKNPLNAVLAMASLPPEAGRMNVIRGAGQQMANLVSNLLDIQKYENAALKLQAESVPARALFRAAVQQTEFLAQQKSVRFDVHAPDELVVDGDRELLVRVLVNLLTNALKYAPNGDALVLEAAFDAERGAVFRVTDHGKGIPAEQLASVFEKYSQADGGLSSGRLRSTGLGLTFCRMTVEAHGGTIRAQSEAGRFTTFEFSVPAARLVSAEALTGPLPDSPAEAGPLPEEFRVAHAATIDRLRELPAYELTEILDALDELPDAPPEIRKWKASVEAAALAADAERIKWLLG